jgi:hypothetical protein
MWSLKFVQKIPWTHKKIMAPLMGLYEDYEDIFKIKKLNLKFSKLFSLKN